jgi:FkbM family methyltransferase
VNAQANRHDAIFEHFPPFSGEVPPPFFVDFLGCRVREEFWPQELAGQRKSAKVQTTWPAFNEEYYEWVDLLEAVVAANDSFTMVELGAGFGRWAGCGALAARQRGIANIRLALAEPEPLHLEFMQTFLHDNDIPRDIVDVYPGTVSEEPRTTLFIVKKQIDVATDHPREWYGQAKAPESWRPSRVIKAGYHGRDLFVYPGGEGAIEVEQFGVRKLLRTYPKIDLIDLDVQGEELVVLQAAIDVLNKNTKRVHIGTHGSDIEIGLRELLHANKWKSVRDYECGKTNATPVGNIDFQDGIQTWINPRLLGNYTSAQLPIRSGL